MDPNETVNRLLAQGRFFRPQKSFDFSVLLLGFGLLGFGGFVSLFCFSFDNDFEVSYVYEISIIFSFSEFVLGFWRLKEIADRWLKLFAFLNK